MSTYVSAIITPGLLCECLSVLSVYFCHFFPTLRPGLSLYTALSISVCPGLLEHQIIKFVGIKICVKEGMKDVAFVTCILAAFRVFLLNF